MIRNNMKTIVNRSSTYLQEARIPDLSQTYPKSFLNWALVSEPGFLDFHIFRISILESFVSCKLCLTNLVVRYRGINNKGVLGRPWTKPRVLRAISSALKFQFTVKCWKVDFLMSSKTRSCERSRENFVWSVRSSRTPLDLPNFNLNYQKTRFYQKLDFIKDSIFPGSPTSA